MTFHIRVGYRWGESARWITSSSHRQRFIHMFTESNSPAMAMERL